MEATLFDIQRNSYADGPGIRTTVFFKGCNLRCAWCHNPESQSPDIQMLFYKDKCIRCGICAKVCPANNIKVTDHVEFSDHCEVCYACLHNCPQSAIHLKKEASDVHFRNEYISLKDIIEANE